MLDGFVTPALTEAVKVGGSVSDPLDASGYATSQEVAEIIRMNDSEPSENGSDVRVVRADGTYFDIVNTPITFVYKIDPLERPLTDPELKYTAQIAWSLEQGTPIDGKGRVQHAELMDRAARHNQMDEIEAILDKCRKAKAGMEADLRIRNLAPVQDDDSDLTPEELADSEPADLQGVTQ